MDLDLIEKAHKETKHFALNFKKAMELIFTDFSVTRTDGKIMMALKRGCASTKAELANVVKLQPAALTRSLDRLVEQGYIERTVDKDDKRYVRLSLSAKGMTLGKKIRKKSLQVWQSLLLTSNKQELEQHIKFMEKLNEAFTHL